MISELLASVRLVSDLRSLRRYWGSDGGPIRVRSLGGSSIYVRPGTSDRKVLAVALFGKAHVPPIPDLGLAWDLGAYIGITAAHIAYLFPRARVVGVELDPVNYAAAVRNTNAWSDRCVMINAGVWVEEGTVSFQRRAGHEDGTSITHRGPKVPAITLNTLLEKTGPPDFVKMDVEGAERSLLKTELGWSASARSIKVEVHGPYTVAECMGDLRALGFRVAELDQPRWPPNRGRPCVVGTRPD